jgi:hypothetical protein
VNPYIALQTILGLMAVWFFVSYPWRNLRLDAFREHIFSVRDEMFLYAAEGHIAFEHPAYVLLRNRMNAVLRFGHEINFINLVAVWLLRDDVMLEKPFHKWQQAVATLPEEQKTKMLEFSACLAEATLKKLIYSPFFLYLLTRPLMEFYKPLTMRTAIAENTKVVRTVERLEAEAVKYDAILREVPVAA